MAGVARKAGEAKRPRRESTRRDTKFQGMQVKKGRTRSEQAPSVLRFDPATGRQKGGHASPAKPTSPMPELKKRPARRARHTKT